MIKWSKESSRILRDAQSKKLVYFNLFRNIVHVSERLSRIGLKRWRKAAGIEWVSRLEVCALGTRASEKNFFFGCVLSGNGQFNSELKKLLIEIKY